MMNDASWCGCTKNEYALPFAAWELRLYLDTHPCDERALTAYRQLCAASGGHCNYACHTPDMHMSDKERGYAQYEHAHKNERVWHWIDDPWPWEPAANMKGGDC